MSRDHKDTKVGSRIRGKINVSNGIPVYTPSNLTQNATLRNLNSFPSAGDSSEQQHESHPYEDSCDKCNCGRFICTNCKEPFCQAKIVVCGCTPCLGCYHEVLEKKVILNNVKKTDSKMFERVQDLSNEFWEKMGKFILFILSIFAIFKAIYLKGRFMVFFAIVSFALGIAVSYKHVIGHFFTYMARAFRDYKYTLTVEIMENKKSVEDNNQNDDFISSFFFSFFYSDAPPVSPACSYYK